MSAGDATAGGPPPGEKQSGELPGEPPGGKQSGAARGRPYRAALDTVLVEATSSQGAVHELVGERQLWWKCCSEAVRKDPSWLFTGRCAELVAWIDATAPDRPADATAPASAAAGSVTPAQQAYLLARALSAPEGRVAEHDDGLRRIRSAWARSGLLSANAAPGPAQPSGRGVRDLPPDVTERLNAVIERLPQLPAAEDEGGRSAGPDGVLLTAALLMAGCRPRRRPLVRVPVVFGGGASGAADQSGRSQGSGQGHDSRYSSEGPEEPGATGVLELREFPAGPPGLYPDPRSMTGVRSADGQFATALGRAWALAGPHRGYRCVLWRLVLTDPPVPLPQIEGPSLGAAFALGLRELLRYPRTRRPGVAWLRGAFYGLRPRTAVTGALANGERLVEVSGMESKLMAARRKGLRLVAPAANRPAAAHAPEPADVKFAETLRQADRYARRFRTARLVTALSLVAAAVTSGVVVEQREAAARNQLATAHQLADVSDDLLQSDVGLAGLFAEQAYRHHPDPLTRRALFRAVTAGPHLAGSVRASGTVSAVADAADGKGAVAGTRSGAVEQWALSGGQFGRHKRLGRFAGPVTGVAADAAGETVAATDGRTVRVWADGARAATPRTPDGQQPTAVAVSPSGRFVAVPTSTSRFDMPRTLSVLDRESGDTRRLELEDITSDPRHLAFEDDGHLVVLEAAHGTWNRISLDKLTRTAGSRLGFGNVNSASALAPDGSHFTYSNKDSPLPVWPSEGKPDIDKPPLEATTEPGLPTALALSRDGTRTAAAVGTSLHVSRTNAADEKKSAPVVLPGAGKVATDALTFVGDGDSKLISSSRNVLNLWDLNQRSRIASATTAVIPYSCNACQPPRVSVSPDGRFAAAIDGNGTTLDIRGLDPDVDDRQTKPVPELAGLEFTALLWRRDSSGLIVLTADGSAKILEHDGNWRLADEWPAVPHPLDLPDAPVLLQHLPGGKRVVQVDSSGAVRFRDARSGKVLRQVQGPRSMAPTAGHSTPVHRGHVAVDRDASHAAVYEYNIESIDGSGSRIHVIDTGTGRSRTIKVTAGTDVVGVDYAGDRLLVRKRNSPLEIWNASGSRRVGTVDGAPDPAVGPVVGGDLVAETTSAEPAARILDLAAEGALGTFPLPEYAESKSTGMAFTADGTTLVTATEARPSGVKDPGYGLGQFIAWRLDPEGWTETVCSSAGRDLEPDEWEQHMGTEPPSDLRCGG